MINILHSPITWIIILILILCIVSYVCGFRITYAPALENSWDAISACASWAGVLFSFIAIWVAIQIPMKIADRQNKIALFEKRCAFYTIFCRCISFGESVDPTQTCKEARHLFYVMLCGDPSQYSSESFDTALATVQIKTVDIINQGRFLFPFETDGLLGTFLEDMLEVLSPRNPSEKFSENCGYLKDSTQNAKEQLLLKIEAILSTINDT